MTTPKQAHVLSSHFGQQYKVKYGYNCKINRNKARWSWDNIMMDMTLTETKDLIDYYFTTISRNGHSLEWFFYNYDKLADAKEQMHEDQRRLAIIREATRIRTEEWREKNSGDN